MSSRSSLLSCLFRMAMLASLMSWESEKAREELEQLYNVLRSLRLPWVPDKSNDSSNTQQLQSKQRRKRLTSALQAAACADGLKVWKTRLLGSASVVQFGGLLSAVSSLSLSPQVRGCMPRLCSSKYCLNTWNAALHPVCSQMAGLTQA